MLKTNFILRTDSYKPSHVEIYPTGTENLYTYTESRGGLYSETVWFGQQAFLIDNFVGKVFAEKDIWEAAEFFKAHGEPFAVDRWKRLLYMHSGTLPIRIKAPLEGTVIPTHNFLTTCEATDPEFFWLPSYLETQRLRGTWYPTTVASRSFAIKKVILKYLNETADDPMAEIGFKLHDFGARGVSSAESAQIGGMAHLVNFMGSDTIEGILAAGHYYGSDKMIGYSIPALEHSTVISWGKDREYDAYSRAVDAWAKPGSMFACVSDSYDFYSVVDNVWGGALGERVKNLGATVVIRPDSGEPSEVVLKALTILKDKGLTAPNSKGYHVLQKHLRLIQGDGLSDTPDFVQILETMKQFGFSASNIAFGMGGGLLQQVNRDTLKFADKTSEVTIKGQSYPIRKEPKTDSGKNSKQGRLTLVKGEKNFHTVSNTEPVDIDAIEDQLQTVFENGQLIRHQTFDAVRALANTFLE